MSTCDTWSNDSHLVTIMEASEGRIIKLKMAQQKDVTKLLNLPIQRLPYAVTSCDITLYFLIV